MDNVDEEVKWLSCPPTVQSYEVWTLQSECRIGYISDTDTCTILAETYWL